MIDLGECMFFEDLTKSTNIGDICLLNYSIEIFGYLMMAQSDHILSAI